MKTLKITPDSWELKIRSGTITIATQVDDPMQSRNIAMLYGSASDEDTEANAQLIAEAGTVANETGLTPRELLEQRNELLEELKTAHRFCNKLMKKLPDSEWKNALVAGVVHMDQAIKNTTP